MIRGVVIASLVSLLLLVLYLPAVTPPAAYFDRIRSEYSAYGALWGQGRAHRALEEAMAIVERPMPAPLMHGASAQPGGAATTAGREFNAVSQRLLDSDYLRAFNALALLAGFRLAVLAQLAPGLLLFAAAYMVDGAVQRWVKGREFAHHHPEIWTGSVCCVYVALCAAIISSVLPMEVPLALLPSLAGGAAFATALAIANYPVGQARH